MGKTIKVIDLLNKIANGEEVPKKIKYCGITFEHINYYYRSESGNSDLSSYIYSNKDELNEEVEIIEEDKEIEKLSYQQVGYQNCDGSERKIKEVVIDFNKQVRQLGNKLNEVIESVNELKKEGK